MHAVNLGVAVPGTQPGALAATREQYDRWLAQMGGMGFRALRIYTLHYPRFYEALRGYNLAHPEAPPTFAPVALTGPPGPIRAVAWAATHRFFHLDIATDPAQRPLIIGLDTYRDDLGETILPGDGTATTVRSELALVLNDRDEGQLYVTQAYDLFGLWHERWNYVTDTNQLYHSIATDGAPWRPVRWLSNRIHGSDDRVYLFPETVDRIGELRVSRAGEFVSSRDAVAIGQDLIRLRLPWTLLQVTDPTRARVMDDDRATPGPPFTDRETAQTEGIRLVLVQGAARQVSDRLLWEGWDVAPPTTEREKASVPILKQYLLAFDHTLAIRLRIAARTADRLTLDWLGGGVLQVAPSVTGPWDPVGQGAPTTVALLRSGNQFFRVAR